MIRCLVLYYIPRRGWPPRSTSSGDIDDDSYGDVVPESDGAKIFMMFWIVVGLAAVFPVIIRRRTMRCGGWDG